MTSGNQSSSFNNQQCNWPEKCSGEEITRKILSAKLIVRMGGWGVQNDHWRSLLQIPIVFQMLQQDYYKANDIQKQALAIKLLDLLNAGYEHRDFTYNRNNTWTSGYWFDHRGEGQHELGSRAQWQTIVHLYAHRCKSSDIPVSDTWVQGHYINASFGRRCQSLLLRFVVVQTWSRPVLIDQATLPSRPTALPLRI